MMERFCRKNLNKFLVWGFIWNVVLGISGESFWPIAPNQEEQAIYQEFMSLYEDEQWKEAEAFALEQIHQNKENFYVRKGIFSFWRGSCFERQEMYKEAFFAFQDLLLYYPTSDLVSRTIERMLNIYSRYDHRLEKVRLTYLQKIQEYHQLYTRGRLREERYRKLLYEEAKQFTRLF